MKTFILAFILSFPFFASATGTACSDINTQSQIAREAVKSLIELADVPSVVAYYGSVQSDEDGVSVVNVQPHFQYSKDWYKVSIRNSDCRLTNISLFQEKLPLN